MYFDASHKTNKQRLRKKHRKKNGAAINRLCQYAKLNVPNISNREGQRNVCLFFILNILLLDTAGVHKILALYPLLWCALCFLSASHFAKWKCISYWILLWTGLPLTPWVMSSVFFIFINRKCLFYCTEWIFRLIGFMGYIDVVLDSDVGCERIVHQCKRLMFFSHISIWLTEGYF